MQYQFVWASLCSAAPSCGWTWHHWSGSPQLCCSSYTHGHPRPLTSTWHTQTYWIRFFLCHLFLEKKLSFSFLRKARKTGPPPPQRAGLLPSLLVWTGLRFQVTRDINLQETQWHTFCLWTGDDLTHKGNWFWPCACGPGGRGKVQVECGGVGPGPGAGNGISSRSAASL